MNNPPEIEAMRYVLGELDREARLAFEWQVAHDPAIARILRETREGLAGFAVAAAPAEVVSPVTQRENLERIMTVVDAEPRVSRVSRSLRRWAWPLAAGFLLALNLWQYSRSAEGLGGAEAGGSGSKEGAVSILTQGEPGEESAEVTATAGEEIEGSIGLEAGAALADRTSPDGAVVPIGRRELQRLREIRLEYETLARENDRLRSEHVEILQQLAAYVLTEQGVNRLAAMELVDPESYAAGERKGLLDFALNLLTEPGIIALDPAVEAGGGAEGGGDDTGTASTPPDAGGGAAGGNGEDSAEVSQDPYAWSVFDEAQARGFLNLYNLPIPAAGESLQLWVRPATDAAYMRVGEVPAQYHGGSGSLTYTLPGSSQPPVEILVTTEPTEFPPSQPTGPPVLRGP